MAYSSQSSSLKNNDCLVALEKAEKRYGDKLALRSDEFTITRGDSIALVGENGSGKSVFLRVLAGISPLTGGRRHDSDVLRDLRIAYVPHGYTGRRCMATSSNSGSGPTSGWIVILIIR